VGGQRAQSGSRATYFYLLSGHFESELARACSDTTASDGQTGNEALAACPARFDREAALVQRKHAIEPLWSGDS
jgi:hypothetical protein